MKKALTSGEKWLFATPISLLFIANVAAQPQKSAPVSLDISPSIEVRAMEFSPEGKRLAAFLYDTVKRRDFGVVYNLATRSQICELAAPPSLSKGEGNYYQSPVWSPDGTRIAAFANSNSSRLNKIAIWDAVSGANKSDYLYPITVPSGLNANIHYSPDGKQLIDAELPPTVYDVASGKRVKTPFAGIYAGMGVRQLGARNLKLGLFAVYSRLGLAPTQSKDNRVRIIDTKTKKVVWETKIEVLLGSEWFGDVLCVKGNTQKSGWQLTGKPLLLLWDGKARHPLPSPPLSKGIGDVSFNPDKSTLAYINVTKNTTSLTTLPDNELVAYDYRKTRVLWRYHRPNSFSTAEWSPDGKRLVTVNIDRTGQNSVSVFDKSGKPQFESIPASSLTRWSSDSKQLATVQVRRIEIHRF